MTKVEIQHSMRVTARLSHE